MTFLMVSNSNNERIMWSSNTFHVFVFDRTIWHDPGPVLLEGLHKAIWKFNPLSRWILNIPVHSVSSIHCTWRSSETTTTTLWSSVVETTSQEILLLPHGACAPLLGTTHPREEIKTRGDSSTERRNGPGGDMELSSKGGWGPQNHIPDAPCMEYLPTFGWFIGEM